jgi:hypothetical protein
MEHVVIVQNPFISANKYAYRVSAPIVPGRLFRGTREEMTPLLRQRMALLRIGQDTAAIASNDGTPARRYNQEKRQRKTP